MLIQLLQQFIRHCNLSIKSLQERRIYYKGADMHAIATETGGQDPISPKGGIIVQMGPTEGEW